MSGSPVNSDDEFFECSEPFPSKFYAVAVPPSSPGAGLFASITQAKNRLKSIKGSRLKAFNSLQDASEFSACPVPESSGNQPAMEGEAAKFPSVKQVELLRFRRYIETNNIESIENCVSTNPMFLLTGCDTPTILQLVFRFNAIHIAAKSGHTEVIQLVISYLESSEFWARIYPNADAITAADRRRRVLDLYLNSPETGSLSSPLHLASKFGHLECVRVLASHPATILDLRDISGSTALESACIRLSSVGVQEKAEKCQAISRALDERYVVLIDRHRTPEILDNQPAILPQPLMSRQLHQLLSSTGLLARCPGLVDFCPQLTMSNTTKAQQRSQSSPSMLRRATTHPPQPSDRPPFSPRGEMSSATPLQLSLSGSPEGADLRQFGVMGLFGGLRAILGPLSCQEAQKAISRWRRPAKPFWMNLRMMDPEKGYERYGRRLAVEFHTKWTEYWSFLDDFANLQSDYGLKLLNGYLSQFYLEGKAGKLENNYLREEKNPRQKLVFEEETKPPTAAEYENSPKVTPIKRTKRQPEKGNAGNTLKPGDPIAIWTAYRDDNNPANVLSDSLDDSSTSSSSTKSSPASENSKCYTPASKMSPVIGLLNNFIVSSPLRILLPDSCTASSPMLSRPERRVSLFARTEPLNTQKSQNFGPSVFKTPLQSVTPLSVQKRLTSKSIVRRRTTHGIWPSILDNKGPHGHFQPSITPSEMAAHTAIRPDADSNDIADEQKQRPQKENYEQFPFVRRWKNELDLSLN